MRTNNIFITIGFLFVTLFSSGIERNDQVPVDTFLIKCGQSNVKLKVSYPLTEKVRDKIVLWANHPTSTAFIDESTQNDVNMSIELRRNLAESKQRKKATDYSVAFFFFFLFSRFRLNSILNKTA